MPTCNKINCAIVLPPTDTPLPEYHRRYLDSSVSVYVPVPDIPILHAAPSFNIDLWTDGYIAPGLAMFVYIDGHYQCNRSKRMPPPGSAKGSGIEMRVRQKEEKIAGGEGDFVGREWRWVHLDVEQADAAKRSDVDVQHNIGKIEVVVLRCDYDDVTAVEPWARNAQVAGPAVKTSVKASSDKAPSAKPASAASVGLGGLLGFFDGACDLDLEGTDDDPSASAPHAEYSDEELDKVPSYLPNDHDATHGQHVSPVEYPADSCLMPSFGLDGHDYEYPRMIFDPYDQPTESRVPYYHTSGVRRPRQTRFDDPRLPAIASPVTGSRRVEFGPGAQPFPDPTSYYAPVDRLPPYPDSPADFQYHAERDFTRRSPSPQPRRYRSFSRDRQDQPLYLDSPAGFRYHADRDLTRRSPSPQKHRRRSHSGGCRHERQVEFVEHAVEELPDIDPDFQRFLIFQMPEKVERLLEVDHRFVADAVSYMPQLRKVPIANLGFEAMQNLKRNLKQCLASGCYPNGDSIKVLVEPHERGQKYLRLKSPLRQFASDHKRAGFQSRWNDTAEDRTWMDAFANFRLKDDESRHGGSLTREGSTHKNGHVEGGEKTHTGSNKGESGSQKEESGSQKGESDIPWGQNGGGNTLEATGNNEWSSNRNDSAEQGGQNVNNWGNDNTSQKSSDGSSMTFAWAEKAAEENKADDSWGPPKTGDNSGPEKHSHQAPPSHHSRSSKSTDPHAYVQPYFQTWRGNGKPSATKPLHRQPREPYTYLASPTPHVPADQVDDRSHGVRPGKGADYTHKTCRPKYLDQLDDPYAVFVFNYRSAEKLERILQHDVKGDLASIAEEVSRGVLMNMPRERLVEELMKTQAKADSGGDAGAPRHATKAAKSTKSSSHGDRNQGGWGAPVAQPATGQGEGFKPVSVKDGNGGKATAAPGWSFAGGGTAGQGGGFTADEPPAPTAGW